MPHVQKTCQKIEKMHAQRRNATCPTRHVRNKRCMLKEGMPHGQKACKKSIAHVLEKYRRRDDPWQGIIHIIITSRAYTYTSWSHFYDLISSWIYCLTLQYMKCKYALSFILPLSSTKSPLVGKEKGFVALIRNNHWVIRENHLRNSALFSKTFLRKTSRWIANLWIKEYSSMHCSNSQQLKTRRRLKAPWMSTG